MSFVRSDWAARPDWSDWRARLGLVFAALALVLGATSFAQETEAPEEEPAPAPTVEFPGPRAVVQAFFEAMAVDDVQGAAQTFEEGTFLDEAQAEEVVRSFYEDVFLRTRRISVARELPQELERWRNTFVLETHPEDSPEPVIPIEIVRAGGGCRFSAGIVELLPRWRERLADVAMAEGVLEEMTTLQVMRYRLRALLPEPLLTRAFLIETWQWIALFALIAIGVVVDRLMRFVTARVAGRFAGHQRVRLDPEVTVGFARPLGWLAGVLAFELLLPIVGLELGIVRVILLASSFVQAVAGVWAAFRLVDVLCDYLREKARQTTNKFDDMLVPLVRRTLQIFVFVVGVVYVASRVSEDLWGVVAGLGLGSIAVGFAAKDSIENLFGTFTVLVDKPFQIGDWIIVGSLEGTVEQVGFRSTRIRTFYNSIITVPNREFISTPIDNMGERRYRRIRTTLGLTYDTPPEKIEAFCEGVREIIRSHPYTRKDYYHVYLNGFGASSLDVMLYCFVEVPEWATELREKHRLFADILRLAESLGVSFAFPTQTIHVAKPEDLEHTDRPGGDPEGASWGRRVAHELVERSLEPVGGIGSRPAPVRIVTRPAYGDDGADGGADGGGDGGGDG